MSSRILLCCALLLLQLSCSKDLSDSLESEISDKIPESLPMYKLSDHLKTPLPSNWKSVEQVSVLGYESDQLKTEGEGDILVYNENGSNLEFNFTHGDMELELDFMVPKGSSASIYFQGRYGIGISDSWRSTELSEKDAGAIHPNKLSKTGSKPLINATKAPGLWQHLKVLFRAPSFDQDGKKIKNASFEKVFINGFLVQNNISLEGVTILASTDKEDETGPLEILGEGSPIALKNISYKKIGKQRLTLDNIKYALFEGNFKGLPDFTSLSSTESGSLTRLDSLLDRVEKRRHFALDIEAELNVPVEGEYLFASLIDDRGKIFIDSNLIIDVSEKAVENQAFRAMVDLDKGKHHLRIQYYQNVWQGYITLNAEGPGIPNHLISGEERLTYRSKEGARNRLLIDTQEEPELLRGYVDYKDEKKTHALSVGAPEGVNYSYDLTEGCILRIWKGPFADLSNMWVGRGYTQTLLARNAVTYLNDGIPISKLTSSEAAWPAFRSEKFKNKGYSIDEEGYPNFNFTYDKLNISDKISSSVQGNLSRQVSFRSENETNDFWYKIAEGNIEESLKGTFNIDGQVYIKGEKTDNWILRNSQGQQELIAPVIAGSSLNFEIIW